MRTLISNMLNRLLARAGLTLRGARHVRGLEVAKHDLIRELHGLHRSLLYPEMPENRDREKLLGGLIGTTVSEGLHIVGTLHGSLENAGDVCEFGVAQGATSALIANEIIASDRRLWLFDSFEGLPAPTSEDRLIDDIFGLGSMARYQGTMRYGEDQVRHRLRAVGFPDSRISIIKGWVEDSVKRSDLPDKIVFAYLDFDFYEPTRTALEFLNPRLTAAGSIVVDDYGYFSSGVKKAVDAFVRENLAFYTFTLPPQGAGAFCILTKKGDRAGE